MANKISLKIAIALLGIVVIIMVANSCRKTSGPSQDTWPYATIDIQRELLALRPYVVPTRLLDSVQLMSDLQFLSSDSCLGRKPGTHGHTNALQRILNRMRSLGLDSLNNSLIQTFKAIDTIKGKNIAGWIAGTTFPSKFVVVSAHYDHLGQDTTGAVYYGADDNASGVACMLAMAKYFKHKPPAYSIIFVALDKEETGLEGAYNYVYMLRQTNLITSVFLNLNMDMIGRSDNGELYAVGVKKNPSLKYIIDSVQKKTNAKLLMGHEGGISGADWSYASDHAAFAERNIPYLYMGVEDHADYHRPSDTVSKINYSTYTENCNLIAMMLETIRN